MSNSRNWVAQKDCPYAAGSVDVATGATPENPGDATFAQAFGAGPIDVYWALEDANDPPRSMAGIGSLSAGSIDVSSPSSTFDGTTYDNSPVGVITLTSPVTIRCTVDASEFDKRIYATDVTFENLNINGDVGTGATQVAQGDHLHAGVYEPADATILKQADVDDIPVNGATTDPVSSNWAFDHVAAADPHPGYLTPAEGNAAYLAIGAQAVDSAALGGVAASNYLQNITSEALADLGDVTITTPANDQVLTYQAGVWVNQASPAGGGNVSTPDAAAEGSVNVTNIVGLTQVEYDASVKDVNTLYLITG